MPTQEHRLIAIATPLPEDELLLYRADIKEELGRPFCINAELISENDNISLDDLLGQNVTIRLETASEDTRYFNGFVTEFFQLTTQDGFSRYGAVIKPWFWLLSLSENCRIFQDKSYPDIIKQVFEELGFSDFQDQLSASYNVIDYVVQFNETDFNFVSRLMEQEGIFYYFSHENGKHTLVLVDDNSALPKGSDISYFPPEEAAKLINTEVITRWENFKQVRTAAVRLIDYDFTTPSKNLEAISSVPTTSSLSALERFNYPGKYTERADGTNYTRILMERENVQFETKHADSNVRTLHAGLSFTLADHYRDDQNKAYLITQIAMQLRSDHFLSSQNLDSGNVFESNFKAVPASSVFRAQSLAIKPKMTGPQTALVVGPSGEEIHTDKYGRIKVLFHWDRYATADDKSSCWIRVAQTWAGKNWGSMQIPRIGQEVLVEFLDGDPDRPIVIGSVYNGGTMPPYELPSNATRSGFKTRSSKGGDGFNELRIEDKKGEEQIFIHAEKNQDIRVKNDHFEWIGNERHLNVEKNRFELIKENDNKVVEGDELKDVTGDVHAIIGGNQNIKITGDDNHTISGDRNIKISGSESLNSSMDIKLKAGMNYGLNSGMKVDIKGGMTVNIEAGMTINLKAGPSFVSIGPSGVAISGPMVMINSGGAAGSASPGSPGAPAAPDKAEKAKEADNATAPGKADEPKAKKVTSKKLSLKPVKVSDYSPAAKAMQQASESGAPFCEQCEAAK